MRLLSETVQSGILESFKATSGGQALLKYFRAALATCWYATHNDSESPQALRSAVFETTREIVRQSSDFLEKAFPVTQARRLDQAAEEAEQSVPQLRHCETAICSSYGHNTVPCFGFERWGEPLSRRFCGALGRRSAAIYGASLFMPGIVTYSLDTYITVSRPE